MKKYEAAPCAINGDPLITEDVLHVHELQVQLMREGLLSGEPFLVLRVLEQDLLRRCVASADFWSGAHCEQPTLNCREALLSLVWHASCRRELLHDVSSQHFNDYSLH